MNGADREKAGPEEQGGDSPWVVLLEESPATGSAAPLTTPSGPGPRSTGRREGGQQCRFQIVLRRRWITVARREILATYAIYHAAWRAVVTVGCVLLCARLFYAWHV